MSVKHTTVTILPCWFFCIVLHCCFFVLVQDRPTLPCLRVFLCQTWGVVLPVGFHKSDALLACFFVPNLGCCLARRISQIRCRRLECAIIIDHGKKHKTLRFVFVLTVTGSQMCTTSAVCGSRSVELGSLLRRTSLLIQVKEAISPSQRCLVC